MAKEKKEVKGEIVDLSKAREVRCVPVAREILKRLGNAQDLLIGEYKLTLNDFEEYYSKFVQDQILPLIAESDLLISDVAYIFKLVDQATKLTAEKVKMTIDLREEQAIAHLLGVKYTDDVRVNKIQEILVLRDNPQLQ